MLKRSAVLLEPETFNVPPLVVMVTLSPIVTSPSALIPIFKAPSVAVMFEFMVILSVATSLNYLAMEFEPEIAAETVISPSCPLPAAPKAVVTITF